MNSWDDVRIFLGLARHGTSRKAARVLGLNQSTVSRHRQQLETASGVALFERHANRLILTQAGLEFEVIAEEIEERFAALDRQVLGRDVRLRGHIRVSLPDLAIAPLAPVLAAFRQCYPEIEVGVIVDNGYVNLTHRDADIVLRLGQHAPEHLVGRRIASAPTAVYASPAYLERLADPRDLASMEWIRWGKSFRGIPPERWLEEHIPGARVCGHVNSSVAQTELVARGIGVSIQLCYTGDPDPRMVRIAQPADFGLSLWLLTHGDIRHTARIQAFMRFVGDALSTQRALIEGHMQLGVPPEHETAE